MILKLIIFSFLLFLPFQASIGNWPQFYGINQSGISDETGFASMWNDPLKPEVIWEFPLYRGFSSPAVYNGKVFIMDRNEHTDILICINLESGEEIWSYTYGAPLTGNEKIEGTCTTPAVSDDLICIIGPLGHIHTIDLLSCKIKWKAHLINDFKELGDISEIEDEILRKIYKWENLHHRRNACVPQWGVTSNPVIYINLVIVAPLTEKKPD